jgi:hypothetical protein
MSVAQVTTRGIAGIQGILPSLPRFDFEYRLAHLGEVRQNLEGEGVRVNSSKLCATQHQDGA